MGREVATLVMLLGVALLAGAERWDRILVFCVGFGVWDLAYYMWLWVFLRWPPSPVTWDVLFLIPVPWIGPVIAPVVVSMALVAGALLLSRKRAGGEPIGFPLPLRMLALAGGALVLSSFMLDFQVVLRPSGSEPVRENRIEAVQVHSALQRPRHAQDMPRENARTATRVEW
jgi:hypothetical protein